MIQNLAQSLGDENSTSDKEESMKADLTMTYEGVVSVDPFGHVA